MGHGAIPPAQPRAAGRRRSRDPAIPRRALIAGGSFPGGLDAGRVAAALARGLHAGGQPDPDVCPLDRAEAATGAEDVRAMLDELGFDARMRAARAVIVAAARLDERTLAGSPAFEVATRARQAGVPAYAVTATNELDSFDARILDLQLVLEAPTPAALRRAGRKLASTL